MTPYRPSSIEVLGLKFRDKLIFAKNPGEKIGKNRKVGTTFSVILYFIFKFLKTQ